VLSDVCEPLRKVTVKDAEWTWLDVHNQACEKIKELVTRAPVLKYYEAEKELTMQCDASRTGLREVLTQDGASETKKQHAQIEKGLLSVVYGLEKFHQYTYRRMVTVQSDHKLLEGIVKKELHKTPKRLQHMLLRMQLCDVKIIYCRGIQMELADTLG
jgi:hypothetical protein